MSSGTDAAAVRWKAPLFDSTGYATEARGFVLGLDELGCRVRAESSYWRGPACRLTARTRQRLLSLVRRRVPRTAIEVHHCFPDRWQLDGRARAHVGRTMFETDRVPAAWVHACRRAAEIWVPARFNLETFAAAGIPRSRLAVIPGPLRVSAFTSDTAPLIPRRRSTFTFLSVFDWSWRKGWDVLLRAFCTEFHRDHDDVQLLLKVSSSYGLPQAALRSAPRRFVERHLGLPRAAVAPVRVVTRTLSESEVPRLYRSADCFVLPSRGEGWGRPLMEAMASGLPTIGTRWSGNLDFMTDDNAFLCAIDGLVRVPPAAVREAPRARGHRWAEPSVDDLRRLLRLVVSNPAGARARGRRATATIAAAYDLPIVCRQIRARLEAL